MIFKSIMNTKNLSVIDLLASSVTEKNVENVKNRMMYAISQLGIEPSSFYFQVSKKQQGIVSYEKTWEQLLDFEKLKSQYEEQIIDSNNQESKNVKEGSQNLSERQKAQFGKSFIDKKWDITDKIGEFYQRGNDKFVDKIDGLNIGLLLFKNFQ